jgi:acyl-coenzyme A synthetase/AMP-(fatty) acid ligase
VAPAELEAHLLEHPAVADCAVIQIPDDRAGEVPKAFVVKSPAFASATDLDLTQTLSLWVTDHKAPYKALRGGVEFVDIIAKSPSGKILRRLLRDQDAETRARAKPRL